MTAVVRRFASIESYSPPHHLRTTNRRIFGPDDGVGDLVLVHGTLDPGGRADPHYHEHCDQLIFVIAGSCRVRAGEADEVLNANDTAFLPRQLPHVVDVVGDVPLELLITYLPALRHGDTHPLEASAMGMPKD
ncbi:cupin domain-containing protein [Streptomyces sp. NPDC056716]|uniref:cupin domain-containing protein n=1 Tax=unclassified Streptomyces TaxID=2593676 RepID=UPI00369BECDE